MFLAIVTLTDSMGRPQELVLKEKEKKDLLSQIEIHKQNPQAMQIMAWEMDQDPFLHETRMIFDGGHWENTNY